ncbi:50S ribosomal protein L4 [Patescibacteria group bacterium]|nr:50S ribosomal protein L4 [Patescibacteria group bacterium]MCL5410009.1 50S ribosomal protein L4 [Patescibacteria group bacterium]
MPRTSSKTKETANKIAKTTKAEKTVPSKISAPMFDLAGKEKEQMSLPENIFAAKVNKQLLAQAVRIYTNNQLAHHSHAKTRSEVQGSTRKIYRQKGTGGARHGGIRAPIFVGGGIALGPKSRKVSLSLPKKMKKAALITALSEKQSKKEVIGLMGVDKLTGKTNQFGKWLKLIGKKNILLVTDENLENVQRAVRNIPGVIVKSAAQASIYEIIRQQTLVLTAKSVENFEKRLKGLANTEEEK